MRHREFIMTIDEDIAQVVACNSPLHTIELYPRVFHSPIYAAPVLHKDKAAAFVARVAEIYRSSPREAECKDVRWLERVILHFLSHTCPRRFIYRLKSDRFRSARHQHVNISMIIVIIAPGRFFFLST